MQKGIYIIGDSAYSLKSFLLTPYDNAEPGSHEDSFNFFYREIEFTWNVHLERWIGDGGSSGGHLREH